MIEMGRQINTAVEPAVVSKPTEINYADFVAGKVALIIGLTPSDIGAFANIVARSVQRGTIDFQEFQEIVGFSLAMGGLAGGLAALSSKVQGMENKRDTFLRVGIGSAVITAVVTIDQGLKD